MDSLQLAMMDYSAPRPFTRFGDDRTDYYRMLHMGSELDWPCEGRPTYGHEPEPHSIEAAVQWSRECTALAGINAAFARLWGPRYGAQSETVRQRRRDALGTVIQLADKRRN